MKITFTKMENYGLKRWLLQVVCWAIGHKHPGYVSEWTFCNRCWKRIH
jgi:hypothetical protein